MLYLLLIMTMLAVQSPKKISDGEVQVRPHPGGQTTFLSVIAFECLFGGVAGPGKTFGLVLDALGLQYEKTPFGKYAILEPQYRAVLFRRQTTQLSDLIDECKTFYFDFEATYISGRKGDPGVSFNFPKYYQRNNIAYKTYIEGARIFLCHLNEEKDKENHQGFEYQYVGFDELTQFLHSQYVYLFSRCRSKIIGLPPRIRSTSNPTGIGLSWVKKRFKPHLEESYVRYFIADPENDKNYRGIEVPYSFPDALSRCYIPGKLTENLTLLESDPGYRSRIKAMGIKMSKALLDGDWEIMEGQFFDTWNSNIHVIKEKDYWTYEEINQFDCVGCIDYGRTMVFSLLLKDWDGNVIMFDQMTSINEVRQVRIKRVIKFLIDRKLAYYVRSKGDDGVWKEKLTCLVKTILGDTDMWLKGAFDLSEQEAPAQSFIDAGIYLIKVSKKSSEDKTYRIACNIAVKNALYYETDEEGKLTQQPLMKVYERCIEFRETFPELPVDEDNPEDLDSKAEEDHWYDSFKMAFMVIRETKKPIPDKSPKWLKDLRKDQILSNQSESFMSK